MFVCIFFQICQKSNFSNFHKVWQEVLYGFCWKFTSLSSCERLENLLRINKVIAMNLVYYFFGDTMYLQCDNLAYSVLFIDEL